MKTSSPVKIKRVSIRWRELDSHSADDRAVFAFACLAVSEINSLRNMLLLSLHVVEDNSTVDGFVSIQRNMLIRLLTGKNWEFAKAIEGTASSRQGISLSVRAAIDDARRSLNELKSIPGWQVAATLRDKIAFHYDIGAIRNNIQKGIVDFSADLIISEADGNCVFRLGEVVANGGRRVGDLDQLLDWLSKMWGVAIKFHLAVLNSLIPPDLYSARERIEEIAFPIDLVGNPSTRLPVIRITE